MDSGAEGARPQGLGGLREEARLLERIRAGRAAEWWLHRCRPGCPNRPRLEEAIDRRDRALSRLLEGYERLIRTIARAFSHSGGVAEEDLVQEGRLGLWRAAELFDADRAVPFSAYASLWVRQAVSRARDRSASPIQVPVHRRKRLRKLQRARQELSQPLGREPTTDELAAYLDLSQDQVENLLRTPLSTLSLDGPAFLEAEEPLLQGLADPEAPDPQELVELEDIRRRLEEGLAALGSEVETALRLRFGLAENCTGCSLREAARRMGVSHEQVRKLERRGLRLLREDPLLQALSDGAP